MQKENASTFDHLKAILALPFMVLVVIPGLIAFFTRNQMESLLNEPDPRLTKILGYLLLLGGGFLFVHSIRLFIQIGKGTLAPWDPTRKLVVKSLYRYMRNPMITGVVAILLAEALLLKSTPILIWAVFFFLLNTVYFIFKEEPDLEKRFGTEYVTYKKHVPRWLPRFSPWRPEDEEKSAVRHNHKH